MPLMFLHVEFSLTSAAREQVQLSAVRRNDNADAFDFQYWHTTNWLIQKIPTA
jgi:hypothetical protein